MTTTVDIAKPSSPTGRRGSHALRWWVLAVLGIAQLMVVLDATVVNIALPEAQADLGFSNADRQWVVTGYALAFGSLLLLGGRLSDLFGRRTTFIAGLVGFAVASAIGGAAGSFEVLVGARVAQGVFGALLAPAALSLLTVTFTEPSERAKAFGIFGAVAGAGGALGLLLGGALTEWASWRWVMYVNLVFAAVALVGAVMLLAKHVVTTERPKLDVPGTVTVTAALFSIVYGFSKAESDGWTNSTTLAFLIGGVALLAAFLAIESRVAHPLLPLRILTDRTRAGSYFTVFAIGIGLFAMFLFLTYYMQQTLGYTPIITGVAFLPMVAGMILSSTTVPSFVMPKVGPKVAMTAGFLLEAIGMVLLTQIDLDTSYVTHILPGLILMGLGGGTAMSIAFQGATAGVHHTDAGVASAMVNTSQQVGGSIGTALLSTLAATAFDNYVADHDPAAPTTLAKAAIESYTTTFWWAAGIFLAGAVVIAFLMPNTVPEPAEGEPVLAH